MGGAKKPTATKPKTPQTNGLTNGHSATNGHAANGEVEPQR